MDIFNNFKSDSDNKNMSIDLTDFKFLSDDHTRVQNGKESNTDNKGAWRGIRVKTPDNQVFYVTMYNMNENNPVWGDNIQMAEKQMKIIEETDEKIILRGFGKDALGSSFVDYGLTLHKNNDDIDKITLHMYDRNIDIIYKKAQSEEQSAKLDDFTEKDSYESFINKFSTMSMTDKMQIALQTDTFNNMGVRAYNNGNIEMAIENYKQALHIMPINDDALINLARCYHDIRKYKRSIENLNKLYILNPNNRSKIIAYSLLMHLLEDFDFDGGAVRPSVLKNFIQQNFNITTTDSEIIKIMKKINEQYDRYIIDYMIEGLRLEMRPREGLYLTSNGTNKSVIHNEMRDVINWS